MSMGPWSFAGILSQYQQLKVYHSKGIKMARVKQQTDPSGGSSFTTRDKCQVRVRFSLQYFMERAHP